MPPGDNQPQPPAPPPAPSNEPPPGGQPPGQPDPPAPQSHDDEGLPDNIKAILRKERDARKEAERLAAQHASALTEVQSKLQEFEDAKLTEQQKIQRDLEAARQQAQTFEQKLAEQQTAANRYRVAVEKGLPPELAERLRGATIEEMQADADRLLELVGPSLRPPSYDGGTRTPPPAEPNMNDLIRQGFGRGGRRA